MDWGMVRAAGIAAGALALAGYSMAVKYVVVNDTGQAVTFERLKVTWWNKPLTLRPGGRTQSLPPIKDDGIPRIMSGGCTYSYGYAGAGFPHGLDLPMTFRPEWYEQFKESPSKVQLMWRFESDFSLHVYHLKPDGSVDVEITDNGFPRTPEKTCGTGPDGQP